MRNMQQEEFRFGFDVYDSAEDLSLPDRELLEAAREVTKKAYAPYSKFMVGAVAILENGEKVSGTNQENASYPVGICAERVLMASASMIHTGVPIITMAIAYHNLKGESDKPVSPCGMCRQSMIEYEERTKHPIRLILSGLSGKVYIIEKASQLLPLSFGSVNLK